MRRLKATARREDLADEAARRELRRRGWMLRDVCTREFAVCRRYALPTQRCLGSQIFASADLAVGLWFREWRLLWQRGLDWGPTHHFVRGTCWPLRRDARGVYLPSAWCVDSQTLEDKVGEPG